jgi:cytochrome oxidase assembly protein ShyY1
MRLGVLVLVAIAVLLALGFWQIERLAWKENLIASLKARLTAPPTPLPPLAQWPSLRRSRDEFRRITVHARFQSDTEARVYTSSGGLRDDIKGPGYFAFAPATVGDGRVVVINRGFVANSNPDASLRPIGISARAIDIVGVLRWPEQPTLFVTPYSKTQDLWLVRDHVAMWNHYGWGRFAQADAPPFYIEQESPAPPGGAPRPGPLMVKLRNDHLGYAITWFGLAAALMIAFTVWAATRRQKG